MNSRTLLAFVVLVASPFIAQGQKPFRPATCEVKPLWVGKQVRSSNFGLMGKFETDGKELYVKRSFRLNDTKVIASVAISFVYEYSTRPERPFLIRLAIKVSDKEEEELFETVESAEAETRYAKKWNLSVTKNINFDDVVYLFTLRCWDTEGFGKQHPFF